MHADSDGLICDADNVLHVFLVSSVFLTAS